MNDEQFLLANAYLDGEVTAEERRIAEADPEVMAEVERLGALQADLRDVPPPSAAARASALSAAMAAFGDISEISSDDAPGPVDTQSAAVVPHRPRPAAARYLAIAAAVVAVAGLGIIVSQADRGGDDDSSGPAAATEALFSEGTMESALIESADPADELVTSAADAGATAAGDVAEEAAEETAADTAESGSATPEEGADVPSVDGQRRQVGIDFDPDEPITDEIELGILGVYLIEERDADRLPPTPNTRCIGDDAILGDATLVLDGVSTRVYVGVIDDDGVVLARDTDTCDVVLAGSIYVN